jgi:hypothetical protein
MHKQNSTTYNSCEVVNAVTEQELDGWGTNNSDSKIFFLVVKGHAADATDALQP